jgi:hypothetical protein
MTENLPANTNIITDSQRIWIINELGRTESKLAVQIKFKETWGKSLPDHLVDPIIVNYGDQIKDIRKAYRATIDSHEWGNARNRMDEFKRLAEKAEQGICKGVDRNGNMIIEEDLRLVADMIKACREEQDRERAYALKWVDLMIKANKTPTVLDSTTTEDNNTVTDAEETSTDTDQYFPDEEE